MKYGMIIDMKNKNALITNAMLASYINEKQMDYLGMLEPFIIRSLPENINAPIDIETLTNTIKNEYGLDIKQKIIEKILIRLAKDKKGNIVKRETHNSIKLYYVNKKNDNSKFDKRKERMSSLVFDVVSELMDFINSNYSFKKVSYEEAQKYFIDFLTDYNCELYSSTDNLRKIQGFEKHNSSNYRVAKFILSEYEKQEGCFKKIKEIQEGYFASLAIYYFCNSANVDNPTKLIDKTSIILDTRLLIDVLGLNRSSETKSMKELLTLIKDNGGKLCTFDYYVDELDGIIKKYLYDNNARITLDLDLFRRKKFSNVEIEVYRKSLKTKIEDNYNITIIKETDYSELLKDNTWHIDLLKLKSNMSKFIDYEYGTSDIAFENDFNSLQTISYYKYASVKHGMNKAVFVTSNGGIIKAAQYTFTDKIFRDDIDIVISDIDLTAILWLSNYNSKSNLPDLLLLENAYAAICPNKEILNEVLRIIENNMSNSDEEIRNSALLLRYDEHIINDIADITQNDETTLSDNIYKELSSRMEKRIRKKVLSEEKEKISSKLHGEISQQYKEEYQNRFNELENERENITKIEFNALLKEQEAQSALKNVAEIKILYETKTEDLKKETNKLIQERDDIISHEIEKYKNISRIISKWFRIISSIIISFLMFILLYNCVKIGYNSITVDMNISNIVNQIVIIVGTILTFSPVEIFCIKVINKLSNKLYDYIYKKLYNNSYILVQK